MKIKTSELIDTALDWSVLEAVGAYHEYVRWREAVGDSVLPNPIWFKRLGGNPSTNWSQAGPIIEREKIYLNCLRKGDCYRTEIWEAWPYDSAKLVQQGSTPLIAAMRCYVASKLGDEVDVPEELLGD